MKLIYCSVNVVDDQNVASEEIEIVIVLCTGCSGGHGVCNYLEYRHDSTNDFKYAICVCNDSWTGKSLVIVKKIIVDKVYHTRIKNLSSIKRRKRLIN